jgi:integrase
MEEHPMARRPRASRLETRTGRLKLPVRWKPHDFTPISPGIALGYRRNRTAGVWVVRVADGKGGSWTKRVALADDYETADGKHVLTYWQAIDAARKLARGTDDTGRPASVAEAINSYERDLIARGGSTANAGRIRKHLTATLGAKPVGLLTARELAHWRDELLASGMKAATTVRLVKATKAALNLAARRDHRIINAAAWRDGLGGLAEGYTSRNVQRLDDAQVRAVIDAAYAVDPAFGLYVETAAVTGARLNQIARLTVSDLQLGDNGTPRLLMPCSRKGRGRKPAKRPVPITVALATKLKSTRPSGEPLLLRTDGTAWQSGRAGDHEGLYRQAADRAGITGTMYALRHSSIVRSLLANVPIRVVAAMHDTSIGQIEKTYSSHITDFADAVARPALLETSARGPAGKVVSLRRRRP